MMVPSWNAMQQLWPYKGPTYLNQADEQVAELAD